MTRSERRYFLLACGLRLALVALLHIGHSTGGPGSGAAFAVWGGDTFSYLDPVENLFRHDTYAQDLARLETYAGRMPGYGVVYGALRLGLAPGGAADAVVALQLLLSLYALYCLGRLAQAATRHPAAFKWTVLLFAANTFTTVFDIRLLTESFAISALIIGVYAFQLALRKDSPGVAYRLVLAHPGDYIFQQPYAQLPAWQKALKISIHLWYWLLVGLGLAGTVLLGWRRSFAALIVKVVPFYIVGLFCLVIHLVDVQHFALVYPYVIVGAVNLLLQLGVVLLKYRAPTRSC
ncbi:MAG: hypothetical protein M3Y54_14280 [Bacteroidota bacterium]|nr:hypothetical protein [Bacteroidota bacterium]